jgi:hypothetical protein
VLLLLLLLLLEVLWAAPGPHQWLGVGPDCFTRLCCSHGSKVGLVCSGVACLLAEDADRLAEACGRRLCLAAWLAAASVLTLHCQYVGRVWVLLTARLPAPRHVHHVLLMCGCCASPSCAVYSIVSAGTSPALALALTIT